MRRPASCRFRPPRPTRNSPTSVPVRAPPGSAAATTTRAASPAAPRATLSRQAHRLCRRPQRLRQGSRRRYQEGDDPGRQARGVQRDLRSRRADFNELVAASRKPISTSSISAATHRRGADRQGDARPRPADRDRRRRRSPHRGYWRAAGDAAEGNPDFHRTRAKPGGGQGRGRLPLGRTEPEGYTLCTYAAVQVWAEAATAAGSTDFDKVTAALAKGSSRPTSARSGSTRKAMQHGPAMPSMSGTTARTTPKM